MPAEIPTKGEFERMLDSRIEKLENRIIEEIRLVGKPKYIGLEDVADELGYKSKQSASKWLKRQDTADIQVLWDNQPIRINRDDFYNYLRSL